MSELSSFFVILPTFTTREIGLKMVRTRERKTRKANWTEENLKTAIEAVQNGVSMNKTSKDFAIPRSTLRDRLKSNGISKPSLGRKTVFSSDQEKQIADHVVSLANMFYGVTTTQLRRLAFDLAEQHGVKHNFNKDGKMAGMDWVRGFLKRHKISLRKPEPSTSSGSTTFKKLIASISQLPVKEPEAKTKSISSEDEDIGVDENKLYDDNENDDDFDIFGKDVEKCIICGEYRINDELWYHCVSCGKWAHSECSGYDSPDN